MRVFRFPFLIAILTVLSLSAFGQKVSTDYDHHVDFEKFHTYSWGKVETDDPLWQQRIMDAVDKQLQAKGLRRVDSGGDLTVTAVGSVHSQQEYQTFYNGLGPGWYWGGFGTTATTTVQNYHIGTVVVDLYDTPTKQLVWRGRARDTLAGNPQKNEKKLEKASEKMFKNFPPKEK